MITSLDIALKVRQRTNKKDTQDDQNIPIYEIVEAYNKAQLNVVNRLYGRNNNYKSGIESTRKRVDDLQPLVNTTPVSIGVTKMDNYYMTDSIPDNYLHYISSTCIGKTETCANKKIIIYMQEESNLNTLLRNDMINPNFEWGETIGTMAGDKIKVHTLNKFEIINFYLTYLKRPISIDIPGYIKQDGTPSTLVNPDLPDDIIEMCIDETVRIISGDIQNQFTNQMAQQNLQMSE